MKAQIWNHSEWIALTDPDKLYDLLQRMLEESGFKILDHAEHHFKPQGYTCLWLLAESHLAIHTFPEQNKTYIELSSCMLKPFTSFLVGLDLYTEKAYNEDV